METWNSGKYRWVNDQVEGRIFKLPTHLVLPKRIGYTTRTVRNEFRVRVSTADEIYAGGNGVNSKTLPLRTCEIIPVYIVEISL